MQSITVRDRQTTLDIAIQESGSLEAAFDVSVINGVNLTDDLQTGQLLIPAPIVNLQVIESLRRSGHRPATGGGEELTINEGIDFWIIEDDFVVQ